MTAEDDVNDDHQLSGYLNLRGVGKIKPSKSRYWFVLDTESSHLYGYKNIKDADAKKPTESLPIFGAGVSFGNTGDHEFIINIRGSEYRFNADSRKIMMKWTNMLQTQAKTRPKHRMHNNQGLGAAIHLESVPEDNTLEITREENSQDKHPTKRRNFFQRLFSRKSKTSTQKSPAESSHSNNEQRVIRAAPLRSVVGSMQDISVKSSSCKNCDLLQGHNAYLTKQVQELNDDVDSVTEQLRAYNRTFATLERSQYLLKKDYVVFIQNSLSNDERTYAQLHAIPGSKNVLDILTRERVSDESLPVVDSNGNIAPHEDALGFIHGKRDSPMQILLYICELLKIKCTANLKNDDDIYQQWQTYVASIVSEPSLTIDSNLRELVKHSIPHDLRGTLWKLLILKHVQHIRLEKGKDYYGNLTRKLSGLMHEEGETDGGIEKQVKIDLLRTLPSHKDFQDLNSGKIPSLHRILRAYLIHNPEIGYCQGMNFMVGFALLYLDEETSFWCLVALVEVFFSSHHYNLYLSGTQANQRVMDEVCREEFPDLMKHLDSLMCELAPISFNWFMTVFIDSLPVEVVLCVWDVFLVYGHTILYKIALSLIKLHKDSIMKSKDALAVMKLLKKLGRSYYDTAVLFKDVFSDSFKQTPAYFLELYKKHLTTIEEESYKRKQEDDDYEKKNQKLKFTPRQMMVSISDNLDQLDDDLIIKCAHCEANRNFVWLLCSSDLMGQLFILNVASRQLDPIPWQVDWKCLSMCSLPKVGIVLVSTIKSTLHAIDTEHRQEIWCVQLAGSALDISCDSVGNVALALMDGTVAFLNIKSKEFHQSYPTYVDISRSPVFCGCIVDTTFWCGAANKIIVLDIGTLETSTSMRVCPNERHTVSQLVETEYGIWSSVKRSGVIHLWDKRKHVCLLTVDILDECGLSSEKKNSDVSAVSITTIMPFKNKLWIGFGNGRFIICDVIENKNNGDDLNEAITLFKSMENLSVSQAEEKNTKKSALKLNVSRCCHQIIGEENSEKGSESPVQQYMDDKSDFIMVDKRVSLFDGNDNLHEITIKMNQIQRISESSVNHFVPCRQDGKLVLSCMGALNDDSAVVLWSSEKRDGREMWFAQTVSCNE